MAICGIYETSLHICTGSQFLITCISWLKWRFVALMQRVCTFAQACLSLHHSTKYHVLAQMSVWVPFMRTAKALASMHFCTGSPEPSTRIAICVSCISVGNPGDQLIQNANFVYEKPLIQGKIFEISLVIPNGFYTNKMQRRTQIELFRRCKRESWI